jgi:hypothetical protein
MAASHDGGLVCQTPPASRPPPRCGMRLIGLAFLLVRRIDLECSRART